VQFSPQQTGLQEAELSIFDSTSVRPHQVSLKGIGLEPAPPQGSAVSGVPAPSAQGGGQVLTPPVTNKPSSEPPATATAPAIRVDPAVLDFSSQGVQQVHVHSIGGGDLQLQTPNLQGPNRDRFAVANNSCLSGLSSGQTCVITVRFNPKLIFPGRAYNAQLAIPNDAPGSNPQTVSLHWERTPLPSRVEPHVTLVPDHLEFPPGSEPQNISIINDGPVAIIQLNLALGILRAVRMVRSITPAIAGNSRWASGAVKPSASCLPRGALGAAIQRACMSSRDS
jgi:hypothetical protein